MKSNIQINTLTNKDVKKLSATDKDRRWAISFYLGIRGDRDFLTVVNSLFSEAVKKNEKNQEFGLDDRKSIEAALSNAEKRFRAIKLPDRTRTLVMFFDNGGGLRIYKIPVYIPSRIVIGRDFYISPFAKNLQKYPHYSVIFLARDRAKIFNYFWGEIEDETEEIRSDVPQRMNAARATWKGLEEKKIQNHIEIHLNRHLEKVAQMTERYLTENKIPYLIIGSRRELIERFKNYLPNEIKKKIIGSYSVRADQSLGRIKEKSLEAIDHFELEQERDTIKNLIEGDSKKKKMAVLGIKAVLEKFARYKIHILFIGKNYEQRDYSRLDDHLVFPKKQRDLIYNVETVEIKKSIIDELIEKAMAQEIKIIHFSHSHKDFDDFGVGAILK